MLQKERYNTYSAEMGQQTRFIKRISSWQDNTWTGGKAWSSYSFSRNEIQYSGNV